MILDRIWDESGTLQNVEAKLRKRLKCADDDENEGIGISKDIKELYA